MKKLLMLLLDKLTLKNAVDQTDAKKDQNEVTDEACKTETTEAPAAE